MTFAEEIEANKNAEKVPDDVANLQTRASALDVRVRGAYITKCELTSPTSGHRVSMLYADNQLDKAKISATHSMVPAGPYEGIGGQHGFPRWADYEVEHLLDTPEGEKQMVLKAKRSDGGLGLSKKFRLGKSVLTTETSITAGGDERTSMGEHIYFRLLGESLEGLKINGQSLDDLLGEGSEEAVRSDGTLFYDFGGEADITFPAGHKVKIKADFRGESMYPLAMWIWKRPGSSSICFEPVVGVKNIGLEDNNGITVGPEGTRLRTRIELN